jgi:hypothetical protein
MHSSAAKSQMGRDREGAEIIRHGMHSTEAKRQRKAVHAGSSKKDGMPGLSLLTRAVMCLIWATTQDGREIFCTPCIREVHSYRQRRAFFSGLVVPIRQCIT